MKNDGGAAFPSPFVPATATSADAGMHYYTPFIPANPGMSLRDYFAVHAPNPPDWWMHDANNEDQFYKWRWHYADAMLAEREKAGANG